MTNLTIVVDCLFIMCEVQIGLTAYRENIDATS